MGGASLYFAYIKGGFAFFFEAVYLVDIEYVFAGVLEGFDVVGWKLGGHVGMVHVVFALVDVPVDGIEGCSEFP